MASAAAGTVIGSKKLDYDQITKAGMLSTTFLGARTIWDLSERWTLTLAGDIGGFGAGSDFAWDAFGMIGYRFSLFGQDNARVLTGYRALSQDYTDGNGRDKFKWDVTLHGPILGLLIQF